MKTCRVYCRTSGETGKSNKGFGLETQKKDIQDYCKQNDIEILEWYIDDGVSGVELEKSPRLMDLLTDMNGEDYIISYSTCRLLGRGDYRQVMVKRQLTKSNKKVIFTSQPDYDLYETDPTNVLINSMMSLLDQYEKMNITLRLAKSRRNKVKKTGTKGSGKTPLGYKWDTVDGERVVVVNEITKPVVEFLYLTFDPTNKKTNLTGLSRQITEKFGDVLPHGLTPTGIKTILTNKYFIGKVIHGEIEVDGTHPTFITKNRFTKVGKLLTKKKS